MRNHLLSCAKAIRAGVNVKLFAKANESVKMIESLGTDQTTTADAMVVRLTGHYTNSLSIERVFSIMGWINSARRAIAYGPESRKLDYVVSAVAKIEHSGCEVNSHSPDQRD